MAAPRTVKTYPLDGSAKDFEIPFEYLARKFVIVTLIGPDRKQLILNQDYRFTQRTIITTTQAWGAGDGYTMIEIKRVTSATERLVDFNDGSVLRAYDLNIANVQSLHIAEEGRDIATDTIGVDNDGNLDARGRKIVNVANGVNPGDAVNVGQMTAWDGSAKNSAEKAKASELAAKASEGAAAGSATDAAESAAELASLFTSVIRVKEGNLKDLEGPRTGRILGFDDKGDPTALVLDQGTNTALSGALNNADGTSFIKHGRARLDTLLNDTMNIRQFGGIGDGTLHPASELGLTLAELKLEFPHATALTDSIDWLAMQKMMNLAGRRGIVPDGHWVMDRKVTRTKSIRLEVDGVLDFSGSTGGLEITGQLVDLPKLEISPIKNRTRILKFRSAPDLAARDVFILHNPTDFSWSPHRAYYTAGEFVQVHSVFDETRRQIYGTLDHTYTASAMNVYKMVGPDRVTLTGTGMVLSSNRSKVPGVLIQMCRGVRLEGFNAVSTLYAAVYVDRCYGVHASGGACMDHSALSGDNYGLLVGNSQNVHIEAGEHRATRHAVALGGSAGPGTVPYRNVTIVGCNLANGDQTNNGAGASDMHGNGANTTYIACNIDSHANIAGWNPKYISCRISPRLLADESSVYGSEIVGGLYEFTNCFTESDGDWGTWAPISISMTENLRYPLHVRIRGWTCVSTVAQPAGKAVIVYPAGTETAAITITIENSIIDAPSLGSLLWLRSAQAPTKPLVGVKVAVSDVQLPEGCAYVGAVGAAVLAPVKFKLPSQTVRSSVNVAVGAAIVSTSFMLFRHPYPQGHEPEIAVFWRKGVDAGGGMYVGNKVPVVGPYSYNSTRIQVALMPADNTAFTETAVGSGVVSPSSVVLGATASMDEF